MWVSSESFQDGDPIPGRCAFAIPHPDNHLTFSANFNPHLEWGDVPDSTRSFAISAVDHDVPTVSDDVNQEGREVPQDLPRTTFAHWLIVDIPADVNSVSEGEFSDGVVPGGKPGLSDRPHEGVNDYTSWFAGDEEMSGLYKGYDGPCPPWNDSILHHYVFTVCALDVETLQLDEDFDTSELEDAISGHVLDSASMTGTYALNPRLLPM